MQLFVFRCDAGNAELGARQWGRSLISIALFWSVWRKCVKTDNFKATGNTGDVKEDVDGGTGAKR
jgi:hypothetical protein